MSARNVRKSFASPSSQNRSSRRASSSRWQSTESYRECSSNHSGPGPKTARSALRSPCSVRCDVRCGVLGGARCRVRPMPFFKLCRLSEICTSVPASARLFIRAVTPTLSTRTVRREHRKSRSSIERTNTHFVSVTDTHARKRKATISRYPSSFPVLSVKRRRVSLAFPPYRSDPSPLHPTASRRRPP